jgi:hypothetical protein
MVTKRSEACTVFVYLDARIVGSNPTHGMNVWYVYMFILCLFCPVSRQRPCVKLITHTGSPTICKMIMKLNNQRPGSKGAVEPVKQIILQVLFVWASYCPT